LGCKPVPPDGPCAQEGQIISKSPPTPRPALGTAEGRVLARIFQHPLSHNLTWRETLALFTAIGEVEHKHDGDIVLTLGAKRLPLKFAQHKDLAPDEVMSLRHFLTRAGWSADHGPAAVVEAPHDADLVILIDHAGARILEITPAGPHAAEETHHLLHHVLRTQHDADRDETYPADRHFFDAVATAAVGKGRIVIVGHGKGQSNEADHLIADFRAHHAAVHARILRNIVADLPHLTVPQMVDLARHALESAPLSAAAAGD
jgi:hypothetical protein